MSTQYAVKIVTAQSNLALEEKAAEEMNRLSEQGWAVHSVTSAHVTELVITFSRNT